MKRPKSGLYSYTSVSQVQPDNAHCVDDCIDSSESQNHTVKSMNLDNLTSKSARDQTLFTITMAGTQSSRSGLYVRPSWKKTLIAHFRNPDKLKAWVILILFILALRPLHLHFLGRSSTAGASTGGEAGVNSVSVDDDLISISGDGYKTLSATKAMNKIDDLCRKKDNGDGNDSESDSSPSASSADSSTYNCECLNPMKAVKGAETYPNWMKAHNANIQAINEFTAQDKSRKADVTFLGDSITEQWNGRRFGRYWYDMDSDEEPGKTIYSGIQTEWKKLFNKTALDGLALGIAGDVIANLLWRIQNGELANYDSKVFWVLIGTNDLGKGCSENVILLGIIHVVEEIRKMKPDSIVVVNGILPRTNSPDGRLTGADSSSQEKYDDSGVQDDTDADEEDEKASDGTSKQSSDAMTPDTAAMGEGHNMSSTERNTSSHHYTYWQSIQSINKGLALYAEENDKVEYFDASEIFIAEMGNKLFRREEKFLMRELQWDYLHPTALGHKLWGEAIVDYFASDLDTPKNLRKEYADR